MIRVRVRVTMWGFKGVQKEILSEEASTLSGISTRTMHQFTTPSLSQTIWPRWASRQFLSLPIVQTLLPVTFAYSLSSEAVVMRQLRRWKRSLTRSRKRTSMGLPEVVGTVQQVHCSGGDYFEGDKSFMCVLSIKVPIRKKSGNLLYASRI